MREGLVPQRFYVIQHKNSLLVVLERIILNPFYNITVKYFLYLVCSYKIVALKLKNVWALRKIILFKNEKTVISSFIKVHLPSKVVFHQTMSSISSWLSFWLPSIKRMSSIKDVVHQMLSSTWWYKVFSGKKQLSFGSS